MGVKRSRSIRIAFGPSRAWIRLEPVFAHESFQHVFVFGAMKELVEAPSFGNASWAGSEVRRAMAVLPASVEADVVDHRIAGIDAIRARDEVFQDPIDAPD